MNFDASILLFIPICSNCSTKDEVTIEILFYWKIICDEKLFDVLFRTSVDSHRTSVPGFRETSSYRLFLILNVFPFELNQLLLLFKYFIRWINIGLEFDLKVIFRRWSFIGEIGYIISNDFWQKLGCSVTTAFVVLFDAFFSSRVIVIFTAELLHF